MGISSNKSISVNLLDIYKGIIDFKNKVQKLEKGYFVLVPGFLRIRNGPGINFEEVGTIFDQNRHYVFEENNGWGRIGDDQWIMLQYTEKV